MTRIDFHSNVPDKIAYACRLTRKAHATRCSIVLLAPPATVAQLDDALWTFSEQDFLPHVMAADALAASTPIILAENDEAPLPHHQILINLTDATPRHFARFERMFEIVGSDAADTAAGRARYRFYQQRGYPLTHFVANQS